MAVGIVLDLEVEGKYFARNSRKAASCAKLSLWDSSSSIADSRISW
jgi:hypothetical protein